MNNLFKNPTFTALFIWAFFVLVTTYLNAKWIKLMDKQQGIIYQQQEIINQWKKVYYETKL